VVYPGAAVLLSTCLETQDAVVPEDELEPVVAVAAVEAAGLQIAGAVAEDTGIALWVHCSYGPGSAEDMSVYSGTVAVVVGMLAVCLLVGVDWSRQIGLEEWNIVVENFPELNSVLNLAVLLE
jgi:hypothetical protein